MAGFPAGKFFMLGFVGYQVPAWLKCFELRYGLGGGDFV